MSAAPDAGLIGKAWPSVDYEVGREKIREYAAAVGERNPAYYEPAEAVKAGFRGLVAPPMFCSVYCAPAMAGAAFDPELGIDRARLVHGEQTFEWLEPVCAGDTVSTDCRLLDVYSKGDHTFYVFSSTSRNQDGRVTVDARYIGIVRGATGRAVDSQPGSSRGDTDGQFPNDGVVEKQQAQPLPDTRIPEFKVTPDKYLPYRYAGASGDFTPIHIDPEFAHAVGLPGIILHGLYTMAIVARAQIEARGDPRALRRLSIQFRGIALPEAEITITGRVKELVDGVAVVEIAATQCGRQIVRNAEAMLATPIS